MSFLFKSPSIKKWISLRCNFGITICWKKWSVSVLNVSNFPQAAELWGFFFLFCLILWTGAMEGMFMWETRRRFWQKKRKGVENRILIGITINIQFLKGSEWHRISGFLIESKSSSVYRHCWCANSRSASQGIAGILFTWKSHCCVYRSRLLVSIPKLFNSVHTLTLLL